MAGMTARNVFFMCDRPLKRDSIEGACAVVRQLGMENGMIRVGEDVSNYALQLMALNLLIERMEKLKAD